MGKAVIILVAGTILNFGIAHFNSSSGVTEATQTAVEYYSDTQARNIGNSMVGMILADLSDSRNWRVNSPVKKDLFGGTAVYTVEDAFFAGDSLVKINVAANYSGTTKTVTTYTRVTPPRPPFEYAVIAGDILAINSEDNRIVDCNTSSWNTNIHSNKEISINGNGLTVEGFATYSDYIDINGDNIDITPNQNPGGDPVISKVPEKDMSRFSPDAYVGIADVVHRGDLSVKGNITLGTRDDPTIIYVGGKLKIRGTVSGYGIFIVKGDVEVKGNVIVAPPDPSGSKLGIYTQKKFIVNKNDVVVHAQIYAQEEIVLNGKGVEVHGSLASASKVTFNAKNIEFCYKPVSENLIQPFWKKSGERLVSIYYYE